MNAVQRGVPVGTEEDELADASLSDEERSNYLSRAEGMYRNVLDRDGAPQREMTIFAVNALNGLAAVAEARGDLDEARAHYEQAASRAETQYPHLAQQARNRAETIDTAEAVASLPTADERDRLVTTDQIERTPVSLDGAFRDLLTQ